MMENERDDPVVILACYADRMAPFFKGNPGLRSRIAHHIDFPDYSDGEWMIIADKMMEQQNSRFDEAAHAAFAAYIPTRRAQEYSAIDRMRLRLAHRTFSGQALVSRDDLMTIHEADARASRAYNGSLLASLNLS